jgi:hypothetical protein
MCMRRGEPLALLESHCIHVSPNRSGYLFLRKFHPNGSSPPLPSSKQMHAFQSVVSCSLLVLDFRSDGLGVLRRDVVFRVDFKEVIQDYEEHG